jgi:hypothetical protein
MAEAHRGTCSCGAVEIKATGAPLSAFLLWRAEDVKVARGAEHLGRFNKTGMSDQQHSTRCGGHVMTAHLGLGLTDLRPPVLPGVTFEPTVHLNYARIGY